MGKNEDKKPWDDSFSNDRNQEGNLSRVELRRQKGNFKLILAVLISIIALIAIFSLAFGMSKQSSVDQSHTDAKKTTKKIAKPKKKTEKAKSHKNSTKQTMSASDSSNTKQTNPSNSATSGINSTPVNSNEASTTANTNETSNTVNSNESSTIKDSSADAQYITVTQSEGIYRVAKNAGITVSQLQALNGLNDNSVVSPGQKLRIK